MQQIPHRATAVVTEEVKKQIEDLVFRKGEEMDRSKHTITFMGQKYPMNTVVRVNNYNEQSKAILEASAIKEEDRVNIDGDNVILDLNEAAIVVRGQARHIENDASKIFRCFGIVSNVIVSKDIMTEYIKTLCEAKSGLELAGRMCALGAAFNQASDEWNVKGAMDEKVIVLATIDRKLTSLVNSFIRNNLAIQNLRIESFADDFSDLTDLLMSKYGHTHSLAITNFGHNLLQMLFGTNGDDIGEEARNLLDLSDELDCTYLPENYSLTYLPMTDKELDYDFVTELCSVNHVKTPMLADILNSLNLHKKQSQRICLHDIIITQDGAIYRVYENMIGKGFFIRKDS
jgi:hypothetical protein